MMSANNRYQITQTPCKKCSGRLVHVATFPKSNESDDGYEVYECADCNSHELVPQLEQKQVALFINNSLHLLSAQFASKGPNLLQTPAKLAWSAVHQMCLATTFFAVD